MTVRDILAPELRETSRGKMSILPDVNDFQNAADAIGGSRNATNSNNKRFSYFQLFRYSTLWERCLVVLGITLASLASAGIPVHVVSYGEFSSLLIDRNIGVGTSSPSFVLHLFGGGKKLTNASKAENIQAIKDDALAFGISSMLGAAVELILIALAIDILNRVAMSQISKIRKLFLKSILRQDMSWYDTTSGNNFAIKITEDLDRMKEGMGEKIGIFSFLIMTFVFGVVASFFYGWKLTLVILTCCPFIILSTATVAKVHSSLTEKELKAYAGAGAVAEEVISGIRTVIAFSGELKEVKRFAKLLVPAEITGRKKGLYSGIAEGVIWFITYACYAVAMWYGVKLIIADRMEEERNYTPAVLVIVLFGIVMGAENLGFSSPHVEAFAAAKGAAQNIFSIIDRKSEIDSMNEQGLKPVEVVGNIEFESLHFHYPARPDDKILKGLSLSVQLGQTVALVGASGCGKSTLLQLMQRFYDPLNGSVKLDGHDLRELNVGWLREQIGVVGQEPVLFATTIGENIRYGNPCATQIEIENAARLANCHDFIVKLPRGYDTLVGERGSQISGGQKQRIAIARALVRNPKILLLDEATSALDSTSERRVQDALEVASKGRTTLVVSHRLSTVSNADKIVFIKDGAVAEEGTHDELMSKEGLYYQLVNITNRKEKIGLSSGESSPSDFRDKWRNGNQTSIDTSDSDEGNRKNPLDAIQSRISKKSKEKEYKISFRQLWQMNAPEWKYILFGCVAAIMHGATYPIWAVLFGDFFGMMSDGDDEYVQSQANLFAYLFIVIGVIAGLGTLLQTHMFNVAGVKMTSRLRQQAFKAIISHDVSYFDDAKNSVGTLCARLSGDCSNVQGATGARIGLIVQSISTLTVGTVLALIFSWNLTLVTLVTIPFVCFSVFLESRFMKSNAYAEKLAIENASRVAVEAIANIRTVASLGQEKSVLERYYYEIDRVDTACRKKTRFRGVVFGLSQVAPFIAYGISMYYGGQLVASDRLPYEDVIKVSEALIFGSWMLGQTFAYAPNISAAILSAGRLLKLFEHTPSIHSPQDKAYNTAKKTQGDITYENVDFHYPNRKTIPVLRNLNLDIKKGTTVALVGPSGSGKSTCVQLLLRYYDPVKGQVNLSGIPTTEFSVHTLRSKMGLVSQEPVLFDRTIAENIAYGDNFRDDIPMIEIIEAAKKANIHNFVESLPMGYETSLGSKGAQLSGGQKQRIAIARALVRNPKILVLDEATSALDMESEKVVQQAMDAARFGRTCLTIAHRLTTVHDADLICVLRKGVIVEQGNHDELMALNGIYAELYWMQQVS